MQTKEKVVKFEKFVAENEAKRRRALKSCEASRAQNIFKKQQIKDLTEQLKGFRDRWDLDFFFNLKISFMKLFLSPALPWFNLQEARFKGESGKIQNLWGLFDKNTRLSPQQ